MRRRPYAAREAERRDEAAAASAFYADGPGSLLLDDASDAKATCCGLCKQAATTDDYCHGCKTVICAACDHPNPDARPQGGPHKAEDHLVRAKALS